MFAHLLFYVAAKTTLRGKGYPYNWWVMCEGIAIVTVGEGLTR